MDLKSFSGESFDSKEWINAAFQQHHQLLSSGDNENREQFASSMVMKLQLLISKLNASLEEQSGLIGDSMPRVLRETESIQSEAEVLSSKMTFVRAEVEQVNRETGSSMRQLVQMDLLKARIQATSKALQEADNWTTLSTEIEDAMDNGDLEMIAEKLTGIQASLKILSHVPDFEERIVLVEGFKNRLEAMASPQLVAAFNSDDLERAIFFVGIFGCMERADQLLKYYRKCLKARILKSWVKVLDEKQHQAVLEWSKAFFDQLETLIEKQQIWFDSAFSSHDFADHMVSVLLEVYYGIDPKFDVCIDAGLKTQGDPLTYLIKLKKTFNAHSNNVDKILMRGKPEPAQNDASLRELAKIFFSPFMSHVARYGERERVILIAEISTAHVSSKDILDELRNCAISVSKLVRSFREASKRCCQLTEGCAYPSLIEIFEVCLKDYLERYSALMKRLHRRKTAANSWNIFQQSLTLNQAAGELLLQLEELDITLSMDFLESTKAFLGSETKDRAFDQHHLFLLDSHGLQKVEKFFSEVQAGINYPVTTPCIDIVSKLCKDLQATTFAILFHPVHDQLNGISESPVWGSTSAGSDSLEADMPEFGFSPQEYITQIGQYLMTIPQHLEPYMTNENPALTRAFQVRFSFCNNSAPLTAGYGESCRLSSP